jgi:septum formation protein
MVLILGSQSPRRYEILSYFSLPFEQIAPKFDEDSVHFKGNPVEYVCAISKGKADQLYHLYPQRTILTADTTVYRQGKIYGKPQNEQEAIAALNELNGQWHSVYTGITVRRGHEEFTDAEETRVLFNPLTAKQIEEYHRQLHLYDKAGSYQMQMAGGLIVRKIDGCYYNVVGLPINTVRRLLKQIGIELWEYLK